MDIEKLIEQLNDWNEKYISNLCGDRTIKCEEYCIKDDCLIVKAAAVLSTLQTENAQLRGELEYEQEHANEYHEECGQWEAEDEKLRAELEQVKWERDAAVSDLETIMAYNSDTCQFCKNGQCYVRGGTKSCLPKWRGQKEE